MQHKARHANIKIATIRAKAIGEVAAITTDIPANTTVIVKAARTGRVCAISKKRGLCLSPTAKRYVLF